MKLKFFFIVTIICCLPLPGMSYSKYELGDTLFVFLKSGGCDVYPTELVQFESVSDGRMMVSWGCGFMLYDAKEIDHIDNVGPTNLPELIKFILKKCNNDQLVEDIEVSCINRNYVKLSVGGIGKWLTPSFTLSDSKGNIYLDGKLQESGSNRHHFNKDIKYIVAFSNMRILKKKSAGNDMVFDWEPYGREYTIHVDWRSDNVNTIPSIRIITKNGQMIDSKDYYLDAEISFDGAGVFPSMDAIPVHVKGRGNTTWSSNMWDKNPYRLKFDEKIKPFGLKKGKNWVLLANKKRGSLLTNAIGMKLACLVGTAGANHIIPIDLYINGEYRGHYNFTEKVGLSNNSIDLEDNTNAVLLELDSYYDEKYKFRSSSYDLPVNIKEPDFDNNPPTISKESIIADFNRMVDRLKNGSDISDLVDIEYLARFLFVTEMVENYEFFHPKSTFLYKASLNANDKYVFGPIWDLDLAFGHGFYGTYYTDGARDNFFEIATIKKAFFAHDLRCFANSLDREYYKVWKKFVTYQLDELLDFCQDYYNYVHNSINRDNQLWQNSYDYETATKTIKEWISSRAEYIYEQIESFDLDNESLEAKSGGALNGRNGKTIVDSVDDIASMIMARSYNNAGDANGDGKVDVVDIVDYINMTSVNLKITNLSSHKITLSPLFKFVLGNGRTDASWFDAMGSVVMVNSGEIREFKNVLIPNSKKHRGQTFAESSKLEDLHSNIVLYDIPANSWSTTTIVAENINPSVVFEEGHTYEIVIR